MEPGAGGRRDRLACIGERLASLRYRHGPVRYLLLGARLRLESFASQRALMMSNTDGNGVLHCGDSLSFAYRMCC
jgi:hypothetical protein